ncbi:MAG: hypothetical protein Q8Q33_06375 [Chlamydiota bacterium]|nr:hypothetical protein [Chlamydiota bacterium]
MTLQAHRKYCYSIGFVAIFTFFIFIFTFAVNAQGIPLGNEVEVTASADSPIPGQKVTVTAKSFNSDINSSKNTWTVNGAVAESGIGLTSITVTSPELGKRLTVKFTAVTTDGITLTGSTIVGSGSVDMIVENDGYVPPFFLGKLPVAFQNTVKIVAIPHLANSAGTEYDPKTLVYQWKKNSRVIEDQSGYGKQSITLVGDVVPRAYNISVTVSTRDGSAQAQGIKAIEFASPSINFYVDDPLYGPLFNMAVGKTMRIGQEKETGVLAVPFGFNSVNTSGNLSLNWLINSFLQSDLSAKRSVILRAPAGQGGSSNIQLEIRNNAKILQGATAGFSAVFSARSNTGEELNAATF